MPNVIKSESERACFLIISSYFFAPPLIWYLFIWCANFKRWYSVFFPFIGLKECKYTSSDHLYSLLLSILNRKGQINLAVVNFTPIWKVKRHVTKIPLDDKKTWVIPDCNYHGRVNNLSINECPEKIFLSQNRTSNNCGISDSQTNQYIFPRHVIYCQQHLAPTHIWPILYKQQLCPRQCPFEVKSII